MNSYKLRRHRYKKFTKLKTLKTFAVQEDTLNKTLTSTVIRQNAADARNN